MEAPEFGLALRRSRPVLELSLIHMYYDMFLIGLIFVGSQNTDMPFVDVAVHSQFLTLPVNVLYAHICI